MANPFFDPNAHQAILQHIQQVRAEADQKLNGMAANVRHAMAAQQRQVNEQLESLSKIATAIMQGQARTQGAAGIVRIEDLPGRRVPYDLLVDIPIGGNTTAPQQGSVTISQDGPFVAVRRFMAFQSAYQFQVNTDGETALFTGRTYGRYRPTSSVADYQDANGSNGSFNIALPYTSGAPIAVPETPNVMSGGRSMVFDGRITMVNAGSGYPRQNLSVPSVFWSEGIATPTDLAALDFFERGEVLTFNVQPNHVNNPSAGNVDGALIYPTVGAGWPFLDGQFDRHEGVGTPDAFTFPGSVFEVLSDDVISRLPDGILTIGYMGYRILQPVGPVG